MYKYWRLCSWISVYYVLLLLPQPSSGSTEPPVVTLSHGGQLRGKSVAYNDTVNVDLFLGKYNLIISSFSCRHRLTGKRNFDHPYSLISTHIKAPKHTLRFALQPSAL